MKKLLLVSILSLVACGKDGSNGLNGMPGVPGPTPSPIPTSASIESYAGFYVMPDGGYLEIVQDSGGLNDLNTIRLIFRNSDNTAAILPLTSLNNLPTQNEEVFYANTLAYTAANNVKIDSMSTVITGNLITFLRLYKLNNKLIARVQISNGASVIFDHDIVQQ